MLFCFVEYSIASNSKKIPKDISKDFLCEYDRRTYITYCGISAIVL